MSKQINGVIHRSYILPYIYEAQRQVDNGWIERELYDHLKFRGVLDEIKNINNVPILGKKND